MENVFTIESVGLIVTVLSLVFAIWQYGQNRVLKKIIAIEAVELHNNLAVALGATQAAKTAINSGLSPIIEVGRAEGLCQALLHESAKLYCNLANTKVDDIDDLIDSGQLNNQYRQLYYSYSDHKRGRLRLWLKGINRKK